MRNWAKSHPRSKQQVDPQHLILQFRQESGSGEMATPMPFQSWDVESPLTKCMIGRQKDSCQRHFKTC